MKIGEHYEVVAIVMGVEDSDRFYPNGIQIDGDHTILSEEDTVEIHLKNMHGVTYRITPNFILSGYDGEYTEAFLEVKKHE